MDNQAQMLGMGGRLSSAFRSGLSPSVLGKNQRPSMMNLTDFSPELQTQTQDGDLMSMYDYGQKQMGVYNPFKMMKHFSAIGGM